MPAWPDNKPHQAFALERWQPLSFMSIRQSLILTLAFTFSFSVKCISQDTIIYQAIVDRSLIYETIELYPDSTFKWTSEYDLSWNEYGFYTTDNKYLHLYYISRIEPFEHNKLSDSTFFYQNIIKEENYLIGSESIYKLDHSGKMIKRIRDKSFKTNWSWLVGHRYEIIKR